MDLSRLQRPWSARLSPPSSAGTVGIVVGALKCPKLEGKGR
jgi:hypothetical protein